MLGTEWVAPGKGETVGDLLDACPAYVVDTYRGLIPYLRARTSLGFTGERLRRYDFERVAEALRRVREGEE